MLFVTRPWPEVGILKRESRIVYMNGRFVTLDDSRPSAGAVAVRGGRFVAVGPTAGALEAAGPGASVCDLRGLTVVPGFIDSHLHFASYGLGLQDVDLSGAASVREILSLIGRRASLSAAGEWVVAHGYNHLALAESRHPSRTELDFATPRNPVYLRHSSGHLCVVNSAALRLAAIDRETPDPEGGVIGRDAAGEPDGVLHESAQMLVRRLRLPHARDQLVRAIALANAELVKRGVTSCHEARAGRLAPDEVEAYIEASRRGLLQIRVHLMADGTTGAGGRPSPEWAALPGDDRALSGGTVKFFADGSILTGTAAFSGDGRWAPVRLGEIESLREAVRNGWRVAVHAIGDLAVDAAVTAIASEATGGRSRAKRHRIEHCGLPSRIAVEMMARMGIMAVGEPSFVAGSGDDYESLLGRARAERLFPVASLLRAGIRVAFGTDLPASRSTPVRAIHDAVNRSTPSGNVLGGGERIGALQALRCMTSEGAHASMEERIKGVIRPGMLADFAVLSDDITRTAPESIGQATVVATVIGGEPVFGAPDLGW